MRKGIYDWAFTKKEEDDEESEDEITKLLKSDKRVKNKHSIALQPGNLNYTRKAPITKNESHSSVLQAVEFHPSESLVFTAGLDKRLKLFSVGETSSKLTSIVLRDLPITHGGFINQGRQILLSGNRKHFYYYDIESDEINKVTHIFGHQEEKDLRSLTTNPKSNFFSFTSDDGKTVMVLSTKTK